MSVTGPELPDAQDPAHPAPLRCDSSSGCVIYFPIGKPLPDAYLPIDNI